MSPNPMTSILEVIDVMEDLDIPYHVGGSLASSVHGIPRQTNDVDLVADIPLSLATTLEQRLKDHFYIDADMIRRAVRTSRSFNLVHFGTGFKVDIFALGQNAFDYSEFSRHALHHLDELSRSLMVKSPEDTILRKLEWYQLGGGTSDRQWNDLLGIVKTQGSRLDQEYLHQWAPQLGVAEFLEKLLQESASE